MTTAHVAYACRKSRGIRVHGRYHLVLNDDLFVVGSFRRECGETLCPRRRGFWSLEERSEGNQPNCHACLAAAR
jgi:hypothetical protein